MKHCSLPPPFSNSPSPAPAEDERRKKHMKRDDRDHQAVPSSVTQRRRTFAPAAAPSAAHVIPAMRSPNPSVGSDQPMLALTGPDPWGCWKRFGMQWKLNSSVYTRMSAKEFAIGIDDGDESSDWLIDDGKQDNGGSSAWRLSLRHVCVAIITSFLFGYHVGVVNEPLENIAMDLGFSGNTMAEGLVVSMCLGGAFIGCMFSGWIADGIGRRRVFQLSVVPMIVGPCLRFLVGIGMGVGPPVASLYATEVSPLSVRGTYGSFIQIATCLGILGALFFGTPVKEVVGWWRVCFWVSVIPAALLAFGMEFSAESPYWLYKDGNSIIEGFTDGG